MRLSIEISDKQVHDAIDSHLRANVAEIVDERVRALADEIIEKKLYRFDPEAIASEHIRKSLDAAITAAVVDAFCNSLGRWDKEKVKQALSVELLNMVKQL